MKVYVLGTRMAVEGSGGYSTNSTQYALLVESSGGSRQIVEGDAREISGYLPYIQVPPTCEEIQDIIEKSISEKLPGIIGKELVAYNRKSHPIPNIRGKLESEAVAMLKESGFNYSFNQQYPDGIPEGIINNYYDDDKDLLKIRLDVFHAIPDVIGMDENQALQILGKAGFQTKVVQYYYVDEADNTNKTVKSVYRRNGDYSLEATVYIKNIVPHVLGMESGAAIQILKQAGYNVTSHPVYL